MTKKLSKRMQAAQKNIDRENLYTLDEAIKLVQAGAKAKFDENVDISINLGVDVRQADQNIRGMLVLPKGTGKDVKVAVFAKDDKAEAAKKAGADIVGAEDLMEKIQGGFTDFDVCIATPDMMPIVGRLGQILGPRGLMPNPKLGTVTPDVEKAVKDSKGGAIEYRAEKNGIVHAGVGKVSFKEADLKENIEALINELMRVRPTGLKAVYLQRIALSSTMGPGVKIDPAPYRESKKAA